MQELHECFQHYLKKTILATFADHQTTMLKHDFLIKSVLQATLYSTDRNTIIETLRTLCEQKTIFLVTLDDGKQYYELYSAIPSKILGIFTILQAIQLSQETLIYHCLELNICQSEEAAIAILHEMCSLALLIKYTRDDARTCYIKPQDYYPPTAEERLINNTARIMQCFDHYGSIILDESQIKQRARQLRITEPELEEILEYLIEIGFVTKTINAAGQIVYILRSTN